MLSDIVGGGGGASVCSGRSTGGGGAVRCWGAVKPRPGMNSNAPALSLLMAGGEELFWSCYLKF